MNKLIQFFKIKNLRDKILIVVFLLLISPFFAIAASIQDNATGGDCASIGIWDNSTKTCTLTTDLNEPIQIDGDNITLDGNNYQVVGNNNVGSGITIDYWKNIAIKNIRISNFSYGIYISNSENNSIINNVISNNSAIGIVLSNSHANLITENEISNNQTGMEIWYYAILMSDNKVYRNNFLNNGEQIYAVYDANDSFYQNPPIGGNYWSNFDEPLEGCLDLNNNGFCDFSYVFNDNSQDNYSWTKQDGWKPANQQPILSDINQYKSDSITQIQESGITTEDAAIFKVNIIDPDGDDAKLEIELRRTDELNGNFANTATASSTYISSGATSTITVYGLSEGQYHWQARVIDSQNNASQWQEFGTAGNMDFIVELSLNVKAAELAKQLVSQNYLWGGKGWDMNNRLFVDTDTVKTGYNYWNPNIGNGGGVVEGNGVDCSGLTAWSYNRTNNPLKNFTSNFIKYEGADGQYKYNMMQATTTSDVGVQPGDFIFFDWGKYTEGSGWSHIKDGRIDHVSMYVGDQGDYDVVEALNKYTGVHAVTKQGVVSLSGFVAFGRPKNATIAMSITKSSPVHLSVTDPDGNSVSDTTGISTDEEYIRESGDLMYSTIGIDAQGYPEDIVYSPVLKQGTYLISVSPMASTTPDQTYSLDFTAGSTTILLAQNVPLNQIPTTGSYGIVVGVDNSITLDTTPPEATLTFDSVLQKLNIVGADNLSSTTVSTTATSTIITDESGNTLQIIFGKFKQEKNEIKLELQDMVYNGVSTSTIPKITLKYEWSADRSGNLKELEQKAIVGTLKIEAHYDAKKNVTKIQKNLKEKNDGGDDDKKEIKETLSGLRILNLVTDKGSIIVEY